MALTLFSTINEECTVLFPPDYRSNNLIGHSSFVTISQEILLLKLEFIPTTLMIFILFVMYESRVNLHVNLILEYVNMNKCGK